MRRDGMGFRKMLKAEREGNGMEHSTFLRYFLGLESIWLARRVCPVYIINYGQYMYPHTMNMYSRSVRLFIYLP